MVPTSDKLGAEPASSTYAVGWSSVLAAVADGVHDSTAVAPIHCTAKPRGETRFLPTLNDTSFEKPLTPALFPARTRA